MSSLDKSQRLVKGERIVYIGLLTSLLLTILKGIGGIIGHSGALIADAIHSLSDFLSDILVLIGLRVAERPVDETHPYGHGRIETIATFILGIILGMVGFGIAYKSVVAIISGSKYDPSLIALLISLASIISKEILYRYTIKVSIRINSQALKANAWHHRSDALSSVAVFIGIAGARLNPAWWILDPLAAVAVALLIIKVSADICWGAMSDLADTAVNKETRSHIEEAVCSVAGVLGLHGLKSRHVGNEIFVDIHIEVSPRISVTEGHYIASLAREAVLRQIHNIGDVHIHIEQEGSDPNKISKTASDEIIEKNIYQTAKSVDGIMGLHGLKIRTHGKDICLEVDIEVDPYLQVIQGHELAKKFRQKLLQLPNIKEVMVHVDVYNG